MVTKRFGSGNDFFRGTPVADTVYGGKGNDRLYGEGGDDRLYGDAGDDKLYGGKGDDRIFGGTGRDEIDAGAGFDLSVTYDPDADRVRLGSGDDTASSFNDRVDGGDGYDRFLVVDDTYHPPARSHDILTGGRGVDFFDANINKNGFKNVVEITDLRPNEYAQFYTDDPKAENVIVALVNGEGGIIMRSPSTTEIAFSAHDVTLTFNGADRDQIILRGAADWLHLA